MIKEKLKQEPIVHLSKRPYIKQSTVWLIRISAVLLSMLVCGIVTSAISGKSFDYFYVKFFKGIFGSENSVWEIFHDTSLFLIIALAVTPCFKMKFWNIGGEGQILMGALGCGVALNLMGGKYPDSLTMFVALLLSVVLSITWAVIPALFKAKWNTNETLLTLMMNYIATCLTAFFIKSVATTGTGILTFENGTIGPIGGNEFALMIIVAVFITLFMYVYLKYSKHGYEISVVGESENTAKYIGINTKKVIIRTLVLCGAICGIVGFLLVAAKDHSLNSISTVGGRGFTGVLISWLSQFNPILMAIVSFLFVFIDHGSSRVGNFARLGASYPSVMTGIFFFFIIATEFFINFKVKFNFGMFKKNNMNSHGTLAAQTDVSVQDINNTAQENDNDKQNIDRTKEDK